MKVSKVLIVLIILISFNDSSAQGKADFIPADAEVIFEDDFSAEIPEEFPKYWKHIHGNVQANVVSRLGTEETVVEFVSTGEITPNIVGNYLGESFKIEFQVYFYNVGNEYYTLNLINGNDSGGKEELTIRPGTVSHKSTGNSRTGLKEAAGWKTIQISFNKGNLKVYYEGQRLILAPNVDQTSLTHLTFGASSNGPAKGDGNMMALLNYIKIVEEGMPLYEQLQQQGKIVLNSITFDSDSYEIKTESFPTLLQLEKMLTVHPEISISIQGHTDANGSAAANQKLSENRANSVLEYLKAKGIEASRLSSQGFGEEKPIVLGENAEAWAMNRRVEIIQTQ